MTDQRTCSSLQTEVGKSERTDPGGESMCLGSGQGWEERREKAKKQSTFRKDAEKAVAMAFGAWS